jgi:hypothetical protein
MLIQQGNVESLSGPWFAIEMASDSSNQGRMEELILEIVRWTKGEPMQLLFPVSGRGMQGVQLLSPYLWIRIANPRKISEASSHRRGKIELQQDSQGRPIPIEDQFVQEMIRQCRGISEKWSSGIEPGCFVRVLYGRYRLFCGEVLKQRDGIAEVGIRLRVRQVKLTVPVAALENLGTAKRDYFYSG